MDADFFLGAVGGRAPSGAVCPQDAGGIGRYTRPAERDPVGEVRVRVGVARLCVDTAATEPLIGPRR